VVDPARVRRLLTALSDHRARLAELASMPIDDYVEQQAFAGRYLVQASAQICIDLANHLISSEGWRVPRDFRDAVTVLEEGGIVEAELAERMRALVGLRNRLVHLYAEVDDARVHGALSEGLADLDAFARAVATFVEGQTPDK
jgi:uncharacterized protein YutE (UPF0331/DUF86 family)